MSYFDKERLKKYELNGLNSAHKLEIPARKRNYLVFLCKGSY